MTHSLQDYLLIFWGVCFLGGAAIIPLAWPILMLFFPKRLEEKVMCPPYFSKEHALILRNFPFTYNRSLMVCCSIAIPYYGKRFNDLGVAARKHSPLWFLCLTQVAIWLGILPSSIGLILGFGLQMAGVF